MRRRSTVHSSGGSDSSTRAWPLASVRARPRVGVVVRAGIARVDAEDDASRIAPGATSIRGAVGGLGGLAAARGVSLPGRRRVHCQMARRNRIPDNVGFDYDEFEDFVTTPTDEKVKERKRKAKEPTSEEDYIHIGNIPPPPDGREDVPAVLSYFSPLYGNKAVEAKQLYLQRAFARQLWEEYGEIPERSDPTLRVPVYPEAEEKTALTKRLRPLEPLKDENGEIVTRPMTDVE